MEESEFYQMSADILRLSDLTNDLNESIQGLRNELVAIRRSRFHVVSEFRQYQGALAVGLDEVELLRLDLRMHLDTIQMQRCSQTYQADIDATRKVG